ncbi:PREDICTED: myeloid differentiation primary response protein MyD88 [Drosophila arizonae]|uniref:Myeloid differentiation primary response protein MyD88 n=1 Tax=Drosophila arizonae TaxID=7263 RepID=A0ABM1PJX7_DROAR|nr:PREDICTED: myeloid differentiation primary response protein MyD88 [Drosophila arizonae]
MRMRPQFVCGTHTHTHNRPLSYCRTPADVSRVDRYRYPSMVMPGPEGPSAGAIATAGFNRTPLTELSSETRRQLACMLNRKKVLRSEEGYERDWRGIASLSGQRGYVDEFANMPMDLVLNSWIKHNPQTAEVGHLEEYLGIIDRWDVRDDIQENLIKDTNRYNTKQQQLEQLEQLTPTPSVQCVERNNNSLARDVNLLSIDDEKCLQNGQPLPRYNACVLYAEADIEHATDIMNNLESPPYNLKLFLRHRDLLLGVPFEHVELSQFMATRCNHLIVVLTEEFLKSRENTYLVNFTQKLQIENNTRKIIPILYKHNMTIPQTLAIYTHVNYTETSSLFNFWDKLARSLQDVDAASIYSANQQLLTPPVTEALPQPETPRILINDADVTDLSDWNLNDTKLKSMSGNTTAPLPELKIKRKDKILQKLTLNFGSPGKPLRHAQSVSAIHMQEQESTLNASNSNLSTYSENKKRSNKWSSKLLKKFTRSSTKLQTPC